MTANGIDRSWWCRLGASRRRRGRLASVGRGAAFTPLERLEPRVLLTVVAVDDAGQGFTLDEDTSLSVVAGAFEPTTFVRPGPNGSVWRYLDDGSDQAAAWRDPTYDDSAWSSGPSQLGYGEGDESTVVGFGPSITNRYRTTYFRHTFDAADFGIATAWDLSHIGTLQLDYVFDDGIALYLNGVELLRENLAPDAAFNALATASVISADENVFKTVVRPAAALRLGMNTLAVEIHQAALSSNDLSFDLRMIAVPDPAAPILFNDDRGDVNGAVIVSKISDPVDAVTAQPAGTVEMQTDGSFTFAPAAHYFGTAIFQYSVVDDDLMPTTASVWLTVNPVPDPLVAHDDRYTAIAGQTLIVDDPSPGVLGNDDNFDGRMIRASLVDPPPVASGTLELRDDGTFTFAAAPRFSGEVTFAYLIDDGTEQSNPAVVTLNIELGVDVTGDLDGDGDGDADDIDLLTEMIRQGSTDPYFDLNGDGSIDAADRDHLVFNIFMTRPGDTDVNGSVSLRDLRTVATWFGAGAGGGAGFVSGEVGWGQGDFDGDGLVNITDLAALATDYGYNLPQILAALYNDTGASHSDGLTADPAVAGRVIHLPGVDSLRAGLDDTPEQDYADMTDLLIHDPTVSEDTFHLDAARIELIHGGPLPDGPHVLRLIATDAHGAKSAVVSVDFTLDTTPPAEPMFDLHADSDTEPAGDHATWLPLVDLVGRTEPNVAVELVMHGLTTVADTAGDFRFDRILLQPGDNALEVTATDAAGNAASFTRTISRLPGSPATMFPGALYETGPQPFDVVAADFNGDSIPDVLTANNGGDSLSLLTGIGDGSFSAEQRFTVGNAPRSLTLGDLNGDEFIDVAVAYGGTMAHHLAFLLNDGQGGLTVQSTVPISGFVTDVILADVTGDGVLDAVAATTIQRDVVILKGLGDGTFQPHQTLRVGRSPWGVAAGHFNADDAIDLAVVDQQEGELHILINQGGGTFTLGQNRNTGTGPRTVEVADMNRDGHADLVTNTSSIFYGHGDGTFELRRSVNVGGGTYFVGVHDVSGDGLLDLVATQSFGHLIYMTLDNGDGTYAPPIEAPVGWEPTAIAATDLNLDGFVDLVTANFGELTTSVTVLLGGPNGPVAARRDRTIAGEDFPLVLTDLDGDEDLDVVYHSGTRVVSLRGDGAGGFSTAGAVTVVEVGANVTLLAVGDLTGDGIPDAVTVGDNASPIRVLIGDGDGTFTLEPRFRVESQRITALALAHLDDDGLLDLVVGGNGNTLGLYFGQGNGLFDPRRSVTVGAQEVRHLITGDFDEDGLIDILTANRGVGAETPGLSLLINRGDRSFAPRVDIPLSIPLQMLTADIDGDMHLDLALLRVGGAVDLYYGRGNGTFESVVQASVDRRSDVLAVGDVNGDGLLDLVTIYSRGFSPATSNGASVVLNRGNRAFGPDYDFVAGVSPVMLALGDVDGDVDVDILVPGSYYDNRLNILFNQHGS